MYNRYIPGANGVYQRQTVAEPCAAPAPQPIQMPACQEKEAPSQPAPACNPSNFLGLDAGDLLLLLIILLLLIDSEEDDLMTILITAAAFLFLK